MDALTHGFIGLAIGNLSGQSFSYTNPIYLAAFLGSLAPDLDIIAASRGGMSYLKQHRCASHSIVGIVGWSTLIAMFLNLILPEASFITSWCWALVGSFSHILMDYFNTHGAALFWPFRRERLSANLINVFDPFLLFMLLGSSAIISPALPLLGTMFASMILYLFLRYVLRNRSEHQLRQYFSPLSVKRLLIMPSLKSIICWDFVVETENQYYVGKIGIFSSKLTMNTVLPIQFGSPIIEQAQDTLLGKFFLVFTPFLYFAELGEQGDKSFKKIQIYDLRYFKKNSFLHSGIIIYDDNNQLCESYIESYGCKLKFPA